MTPEKLVPGRVWQYRPCRDQEVTAAVQHEFLLYTTYTFDFFHEDYILLFINNILIFFVRQVSDWQISLMKQFSFGEQSFSNCAQCILVLVWHCFLNVLESIRSTVFLILKHTYKGATAGQIYGSTFIYLQSKINKRIIILSCVQKAIQMS